MAKNGHSKFFPTIFPKKTGINSEWPFQVFLTIFPKKTNNSEWPKMAVPNFFDNFPQKDWYKFKMAKISHSEFFLTIFSKKTGINLKWAKMAVLNFF